jgi:ABC-type uncharacterized transport system substrate-binding protein
VAQPVQTAIRKQLTGGGLDDLSVELPTKCGVVINLKAAKQIRLTILSNVLVRADRVIK